MEGSTHTLFDSVREMFDTDADMAKAFKMSTGNVSHWRKSGIPRIRGKQVERVTKGKITFQEVRDDAKRRAIVS